MSPVSASFDQWWNGVSLRAKITGVTVLLLTFGLTVAGAGTMTVLRTYLLERVDAELLTEYSELDTVIPFQMIQDFDEVDSGNTPFYIAAVSASGRLIDDNLSTAQADLGPDLSRLTLEYVIGVEGGLTLTNEAKTTEWRVVTAPLRVGRAAEQATLVMGLNLNETNAIIARYTLIYFLFALAVVIFGEATTQLLVTSTFAPLRDVEATAARFANGDFAQRLGGATPNTEVGRLNRSLNTMLARIDRAFAERQRAVEKFVARQNAWSGRKARKLERRKQEVMMAEGSLEGGYARRLTRVEMEDFAERQLDAAEIAEERRAMLKEEVLYHERGGQWWPHDRGVDPEGFAARQEERQMEAQMRLAEKAAALESVRSPRGGVANSIATAITPYTAASTQIAGS